MARLIDNGAFYTIKLSARDTHDWAHHPSKGWPCSTLSGRAVWAQFDSRNGDLVDTNAPDDVDGVEFSAIFDDFRERL